MNITITYPDSIVYRADMPSFLSCASYVSHADPFQSFTPCYLEASRHGIQQTIVSDIDRFWDMPESNGVAASEACPACGNRDADTLEIVEGYNCGAYVRCHAGNCGHEYTIEDQFSN